MHGKRLKSVNHFEGDAMLPFRDVLTGFDFASVLEGLMDGGGQGLPVAKAVSQVVG
jgi:hypothetical protein